MASQRARANWYMHANKSKTSAKGSPPSSIPVPAATLIGEQTHPPKTSLDVRCARRHHQRSSKTPHEAPKSRHLRARNIEPFCTHPPSPAPKTPGVARKVPPRLRPGRFRPPFHRIQGHAHTRHTLRDPERGKNDRRSPTTTAFPPTTHRVYRMCWQDGGDAEAADRLRAKEGRPREPALGH